MLYSDNITGSKIFDLRTKYGYTQEILAEKISLIVNKDISRQKVAQWEIGRPISKLDELKALAKIFDCQIGYLLGEDDYNCRSRGNSFIQEEIGLSEEAINKIADIYHRCIREKEGSIVSELQKFKAIHMLIDNDKLLGLIGSYIYSDYELPDNYKDPTIAEDEYTDFITNEHIKVINKNTNASEIFKLKNIPDMLLLQLQLELKKFRESRQI